MAEIILGTIAMESLGPLAVSAVAATLTMRAFSMSFLDDYLERMGPQITTSVGGYKLEELGAQLFENIEGDYFTILGLPLLPLLDFLRRQDALAA